MDYNSKSAQGKVILVHCNIDDMEGILTNFEARRRGSVPGSCCACYRGIYIHPGRSGWARIVIKEVGYKHRRMDTILHL